jgi:hypothetical protein
VLPTYRIEKFALFYCKIRLVAIWNFVRIPRDAVRLNQLRREPVPARLLSETEKRLKKLLFLVEVSELGDDVLLLVVRNLRV